MNPYLRPGALLAKKFRIVRLAAQRAGGVVYEATSGTNRVWVAHLASQQRATIERFQAAARKAKAVGLESNPTGTYAALSNHAEALALVSAAFPDPKDKARAIGIWTAIASVGTAVGPTLGGFLVEHWGWRSIFLVNVPVGLAVVFLSLRYVKESRDERPRTLDVVGQVLFMVTVGALAYAVIEGPKSGWTSPGTFEFARGSDSTRRTSRQATQCSTGCCT